MFSVYRNKLEEIKPDLLVFFCLARILKKSNRNRRPGCLRDMLLATEFELIKHLKQFTLEYLLNMV